MSEDRAAWRKKAAPFLASAEMLLADGDFDSAASRAYYAMFHAAEALLLARGVEFAQHSAMLSAYGREFAKSGQLPAELHRFLLDAFDLRNRADYFSSFVVDEETARKQVSQAQRFVQAASEWLDEQSGEDG